MKRISYAWLFATLILAASCAGLERDCSSCSASSFGADWIIVQYRVDGMPISCWSLEDVSVSNEDSSDGIYWETEAGNLIHIGGWYNRVQVQNSRWEAAAESLGIDLEQCQDGVYMAPGVIVEPAP